MAVSKLGEQDPQNDTQRGVRVVSFDFVDRAYRSDLFSLKKHKLVPDSARIPLTLRAELVISPDKRKLIAKATCCKDFSY